MSSFVEIKFDEKTIQNSNELGMREMQLRVYEKRNSKYLLIKSPPASGKSRALMFVALDKLFNQKIKKVIIAVPEKSIGKSFKSTNLTDNGYYFDWIVDEENNLTSKLTNTKKVEKFISFIKSNNSKDNILICTHATLRYAYARLDDKDFDNCLLAIDEFHHVSQDDNSVLGSALKSIINNSNAHIIAMTGSYFRGDAVPILKPEDEQLFDKVTYSYHEQLEGYKYLKSFSMDYKFYQGKYTDAISNIIDTNKKTIIHIPNVNSGESTKDKYYEVDRILEIIGDASFNTHTGIWEVYNQEGKLLKVADLVTEDGRDKVQEYLNNVKNLDDLDIVIALGMAKEGFDWPYAEHAVTVGYRNSLTEIVQIIGRVTRDSCNKNHAQFTNLIAQPDAADDEVAYTVNNIMKAITASLLMESVLAPVYKFTNKNVDKKTGQKEVQINVKGIKDLSTDRTKKIIENDINDLKASILQDEMIQQAIASGLDSKIINKQLIPKIIIEKYNDLSVEETEEVRQHILANNLLVNNKIIKDKKDNKFIKLSDKFINIDELNIDLIDSINPFQKAYQMISKNINESTLKVIKDLMNVKKYEFSYEELEILWEQYKSFIEENGVEPQKDSEDEYEQRLAYAFIKMIQLQKEFENE